MNLEEVLTNFRRDVREAFALPRKAKSELRLTWEAEFRLFHDHSAKALNALALVLLDGARLLLSLLDRLIQRMRAPFLPKFLPDPKRHVIVDDKVYNEERNWPEP